MNTTDVFPYDSACKIPIDAEVQNVEPSTDAVLKIVDDSSCDDEYDDEYDEKEDIGNIDDVSPGDSLCEAHVDLDVQNVAPPTDITPESADEVGYEVDSYYDEDDEEETEAIPRVFPHDIARRTRKQMVTRRLYVAVSDDDSDIAALRTEQHELFTHVVRVTLDPFSHDSIAPSKKLYPDYGTCELRLTCPTSTLRYSERLTALNAKQLLAARDFIAYALFAEMDQVLVDTIQGFKPPIISKDVARALIVCPPDRSVDVMAILVCYISFLMGSNADVVLPKLQKLIAPTPDSHWQDATLCTESLHMVNEVSTQEWK